VADDDPLAEPLGPLAGGSAKVLREAGLETVGELLRRYPRGYLKTSELTRLDRLPVDEYAVVIAEVASASLRWMRQRRGRMLDVVVTDGSSRMGLTFFHQVEFHHRRLAPGTRWVFSGKVGRYGRNRQLTHPEYEALERDGAGLADQAARAGGGVLIPVYRARSVKAATGIRNTARLVLDTLGPVPDPLPTEVRARQQLVDLRTAFRQLHRPADQGEVDEARRRLKFEEAFVLQVALARRRASDRELSAVPRPAVPGGLLDALDERLPFALTAGQRQVGAELAEDLAESRPMHRLLQGEVGSGKTLVALRAMLTVIDSGGQAALLAPTEVLAAQHHRSISALLGDLALGGMLGGDPRGTRVALLTGSLPAGPRRRALLEAASGEAGIVVGTHALLAERVQFAELALVVVDEQHRFGVEQRDALRGKSSLGVPHLLVMTATPIPRTVAMTVFGDLETSTLAELPAGRSPIATHVVPTGRPDWVRRVWQRVAEEAAAGHQVYVVCPRIGDDEADPDEDVPDGEPPGDQDGGDSADDWDADREPGGDLPGGGGEGAGQAQDRAPRRPARAVLDTLAELRSDPALAGLVIESLHGRMPAEQRADVLRRFAAGEVQVLVATTVIEVGVDVPNATAMVLLDADRFGVSQLHQLRGRVGRGAAAGLCLLLTDVTDGPAADRLAAVAATLDGFELARVDLEQRREGDVLGAAQSGGRSSLRTLRVLRDERLIETARHEATALVAADPGLEAHPALRDALGLWLDHDREAYLDRG
jgi:ATP-dependent DNA helicase RecG